MAPHIRQVLLVDDSKDVLMVLSAYLEPWGFDVHEAQSRAEAESIFGQRAFDLVFVDLILNDELGSELIARLRESEHQLQRAPSFIVAVSGSVDATDWQSAEAAGMNARLAKPIMQESLGAVITQAENHIANNEFQSTKFKANCKEAEKK